VELGHPRAGARRARGLRGGGQGYLHEVAGWAAGQLAARFGRAMRLEYFDLFEPACPALPPAVQLPVVLVKGELFSSGTKLSMPALCRRLEALGLRHFSAH
jgi:hypothetical protein